MTSLAMSDENRYTIADQKARFAHAKEENNQRYLDISTVFDASFLKEERVAITSANRGLGLALAAEVTNAGGELVVITRSSSKELEALKPAELITGVDVTNDEKCKSLKDQIKGGPINIVSKNTDWLESCKTYSFLSDTIAVVIVLANQ